MCCKLTVSSTRCVVYLQRGGVELGALILPGDSDVLSDAAQTEAAASGVTPFFPDLPRTVHFTPLLQKRKQNSAALASASERTQYYFDRRCVRLSLLLGIPIQG